MPSDTMTKAEHEACRDIERVIERHEFQHGKRVRNIGLARNGDGSLTVWFTHYAPPPAEEES